MRPTGTVRKLLVNSFPANQPLLDDVGTLNLDGISWVICGGESGHGARPCNLDWIRGIVDQCRDAGVACFVKQLGSAPRITFGELCEWKPNPPAVDCSPRTIDTLRLRDRKGGDPAEWPDDLRVREFPA